MNYIKKIVRKVIYGKYNSSDSYINYLRKKGCTIGTGTSIFEPKKTYIDFTRPHLINIGNDVKITRGVTILTHGYDWAVLSKVYNEVLGSAGHVTIGNNVFIGVNTTILKGVNIGNNVIIGANSLVNKDIPNNMVVGGNPARVIMTVEDYYDKRKKEYIEEAKELAIYYYEKFSENPPVEIFQEFTPLFLNRNLEITPSSNCFLTSGPELIDNFKNTKPLFNGYEEFLKWCGL